MGRLLKSDHTSSKSKNSKIYNFFRATESSRPAKSNKMSTGYRPKSSSKLDNRMGSSLNYNRGRGIAKSPSKTSKASKTKNLGYNSIGAGLSSKFYTSNILRSSRNSRALRKEKLLSSNKKSSSRNKEAKKQSQANPLGGMVTQVHNQPTLTVDSRTSYTQERSEKSKKRRKRKRGESKGAESKSNTFKYTGLYYMEKLERAMKHSKGSSEVFATLFRQHFRQCT